MVKFGQGPIHRLALAAGDGDTVCVRRRISFAAVVVSALLVAGVVPAHAAAPAFDGAATPASVTSTAPAWPTSGWRARMLEKINWIRAQAGVAPVRLCATLNHSASDYAALMARTNTFGHVASDGSGPAERIHAAGYRFQVAGENLGAGQRTVVEVMRALRESPSHYATMTDPRLQHVGFGYAPGGSSTYQAYWVQHFGVGGRCT